jgi:REP element-mobilizing transposase RayT
MGRKWSNKNLPGALHFVTGNIDKQSRIFTRAEACQSFIDVCAELRQEWPFKLVEYVLMPDHLHLIINPRDGKIRESMGKIKSLSARRIIAAIPDVSFIVDVKEAGEPVHQVSRRVSKPFHCGVIG